MNEFPITRDMLMAHADGETTPSDATRIAAHLAANPEDAAEHALWQRQRDAIRTLYGPVAAEPVPSRLDPHRIASGLTRAGSGPWRLAAAACLALAFGLGAGWMLRGATVAPPPSHELAAALDAHQLYTNERRHSVEVAAAEEEHLVTWLSGRIGTRFVAPDLSAHGFALLGGRLLPGPAAQLMYENAATERLTVYLTPGEASTGSDYETAERPGASAYYWSSPEIGCTLVADLPLETLRIIGGQIAGQLLAGERPEI